MQSLDEKLVGSRVRLINTTDEHTQLKPGAEGVIVFIDDLNTVFVHWDDGSSLGLIPDEDKWELIN